MARQSGKAGQVWIDSTQPTNDDAVLGVTSWELDLRGDAIDVTGMDSGGAKEFVGGLTEGTATIECYADGALDSDIVEGSQVYCWLLYADGDTSAWQGRGIVTQKRPSVTVDGAVRWTLVVQYSGGIEYTTLP